MADKAVDKSAENRKNRDECNAYRYISGNERQDPLCVCPGR